MRPSHIAALRAAILPAIAAAQKDEGAYRVAALIDPAVQKSVDAFGRAGEFFER